MAGYWWRHCRTEESDAEWIRLYGQEAFDAALRHTEWVMSLPFPPEDDPASLSAQAASGLPQLWPAHMSTSAPRVQTLQQMHERRSDPALPRQPPDSGPGALARARSGHSVRRVDAVGSSFRAGAYAAAGQPPPPDAPPPGLEEQPPQPPPPEQRRTGSARLVGHGRVVTHADVLPPQPERAPPRPPMPLRPVPRPFDVVSTAVPSTAALSQQILIGSLSMTRRGVSFYEQLYVLGFALRAARPRSHVTLPAAHCTLVSFAGPIREVICSRSRQMLTDMAHDTKTRYVLRYIRLLL